MLPTVQLDPSLLNTAKNMVAKIVFNGSTAQKQDTARTVRTTYEFGYNYMAMKQGNNSFTEIPCFLKNLCSETVRAFNHAGQNLLPPPETFTNCIISIYDPGFKLQPHVDDHAAKMRAKGKGGYYFGDNVIGIVLKADTQGALYFIESPDDSEPAYNAAQAQQLQEQDGMAFLMNGKLRSEPYYHGVSDIKDQRISVTFRTVHFE